MLPTAPTPPRCAPTAWPCSPRSAPPPSPSPTSRRSRAEGLGEHAASLVYGRQRQSAVVHRAPKRQGSCRGPLPHRRVPKVRCSEPNAPGQGLLPEPTATNAAICHTRAAGGRSLVGQRHLKGLQQPPGLL